MSSLNQIGGGIISEHETNEVYGDTDPLQYSSLEQSKGGTGTIGLSNHPTFKAKVPDQRMLMMSSATRDMLTAYAEDFSG